MLLQLKCYAGTRMSPIRQRGVCWSGARNRPYIWLAAAVLPGQLIPCSDVKFPCSIGKFPCSIGKFSLFHRQIFPVPFLREFELERVDYQWVSGHATARFGCMTQKFPVYSLLSRELDGFDGDLRLHPLPIRALAASLGSYRSVSIRGYPRSSVLNYTVPLTSRRCGLSHLNFDGP